MSETREPSRTRLVKTNLTGVFSKTLSREAAAAKLPGIASLLDPGLLARLQASDAPGPRAFLERLPASMACWRPTRSCAVKSFPPRQSVPPSPQAITLTRRARQRA